VKTLADEFKRGAARRRSQDRRMQADQVIAHSAERVALGLADLLP
jgi:hypothetical protein